MVRRAYIHITPEDHVAIIGKNGSGKSYLWRNDLMPRYAPYPIILDPKHEVTAGYPIREQFDPQEGGQIIRLPFAAKPGEWDDVLRDIWASGTRNQSGTFSPRRTIIIDEVYAIARIPQSPPPGMDGILRLGRKPQCVIWGVTQRPARIPTSMLSEPNHHFTFRLTLKRDREAVADNTTDKIRPLLERLGRGEYVYYHATTDRLIEIRRRTPLRW